MKKIIKEIVKKYWFFVVLEAIIIAANVYFMTVPSELLGKIIDLLYNIDNNKQQIINTVYILLGTSVLILILRVLWKMITAKIERDVIKYLRDKLFKKMLKTDIYELQSIKNGEIMSHFVKDLKEVQKFVSYVLTIMIRFVLNFVIVALAMYRSTNAFLTGVVFIPIIICVLFVCALVKKLEKSYNESRVGFSNLSEFVQESTDSIRTTKAYNGEKSQYNDFFKKNEKLKNINLQVIKNESLLSVIVNLGLGIGAGLSILFGGRMVLEGTITTGDFVAFNGYMLLLYSPIMWIPWMIKHVKKIQVSYKRLDIVFNLKEEETYIDNRYNGLKLNGDIEIKNLNFNYPDSLETILENINVKVSKGKSLGIIGVIGSGKTTLMNLLLKLYNVPKNTIFIDGQDINDIQTDVIRNNICYITQDNFLFSASLKENINLFRDSYDEIDIVESTKNSMIYDEIEQMENGINTVIGEKGIDLSGGQKQRVVISRAFLSNSNIVIFDDTFSALDNRTEQHVLNNIKELTSDKTCIIVSNRISDIKHCDEIIVLEQGKIVERGIHDELLKNKYKYYEFFKNQAEKKNVEVLE